MGHLKEIIENLIALKQEGAYWDFKREWYDGSQTSNLLHDIICMANNLVNNDSYLIIGIDEDNDYKVKDVTGDANRKNTSKIVNFIKDKKFAGDARPLLYVESIFLDEGVIDVIIIKNSQSTPFYLRENYKGVFASQIYTRIQDTNTPVNSCADIDKIEWLWKKRFGLIQSPLERLEILLDEAEDWVNSPYGEMQKYYKYSPEYQIKYDFAEDGRDGYEYYLFSQYDTSPRWVDIRIFYHQTLLTELGGAALDGGRYTTPSPDTGWFGIGTGYDDDIMYKYMTKGTLTFKLHKFFYKNEFSSDARMAHNRFMSVILLFDSEHERILFNEFAAVNWDDKEKYISLIHMPYIPQLKGYKDKAFQDDYENALILKLMLDDFRTKEY